MWMGSHIPCILSFCPFSVLYLQLGLSGCHPFTLVGCFSLSFFNDAELSPGRHIDPEDCDGGIDSEADSRRRIAS